MLALLKRKTWVPEVEGNYEIIECGFKHGHGKYYMYVFRIVKVIGYDHTRMLTLDIAIFLKKSYISLEIQYFL